MSAVEIAVWVAQLILTLTAAGLAAWVLYLAGRWVVREFCDAIAIIRGAPFDVEVPGPSGNANDGLLAYAYRTATPWSDPNDEVTKPTNCGQFGSYYGPCGGCDVCLEGQRAYYEMLEREEAKAKLRLAEIAELNAAELPGLTRLRDELRQLPEFQPRHNRVLHYDMRDGATYQCTCGQPWPCERLVGRVWEGAE